MRPLAFLVASCGLGALVLAAPVLRGRVLPPEAAPAAVAPETAPVAAAEAPPAARTQPAAIRPVAPEIVAPPPVEPHVLERIEAREPLGAMGRAHAPSEGPPKETILHRPVVDKAGTFTAMGHHVVLAGVLPTDADETCISDGAAWPCGVHARTAFRNWLRGRALTCTVPPGPAAAAVTTPCRLGNLDAGEWLVAQGWARADPGDPRYAGLEKAAREARRGLHGPAPAALAPLTVTVPEPTDPAGSAGEGATGPGLPGSGVGGG